MSLVARVTPIWKKQKLFMGLFLIAMGGWFFWDGTIGWPRSNERYYAWAKFREEGQLQNWPAYAKERGWVEKAPDHAYSPHQLQGQLICGTLATLSGLLVLGHWFSQRNRVLRADDEAVITPAGTRVPFSAITGLGLKKWDSKGIARVRYEIEGRKGEFVVDDYKFDTVPSREILEQIKSRLTENNKP